MIPADAHLEVAWLPVADVVPDPPQPLELDKVAYYHRLMHGSEDHIALGRARIRCVVVQQPQIVRVEAPCPAH